MLKHNWKQKAEDKKENKYFNIYAGQNLTTLINNDFL